MQQAPTADPRYVELLEKVNGQLSLTWTPWSLIFTGLAVLVALVTIIVGVLFYFQGRDYRDQLQAVIAHFQHAFDEMLERHQAAFASLLEQRQAQLAEWNSELAAVRARYETADAETKKELEPRIAALERDTQRVLGEEKEIIAAASAAVASPPKLLGGGLRKVGKSQSISAAIGRALQEMDASTSAKTAEAMEAIRGNTHAQIQRAFYDMIAPVCTSCGFALPASVVAAATSGTARCPNCQTQNAVLKETVARASQVVEATK